MATNSILVPDDLAERSAPGRLRSRMIRDIAVEFAQNLHWDIELLYVKNLKPGFFKRKQVDALLETYADIETSIMKQFMKAYVKGRVKITSGNPAEEILTCINASEGISMVVMGTHGKKGLEKMFLGSVAEEVLRNTDVPVLVLGPTAQEKQREFKIDQDFKILLLSDLSESSTEAESFAQKLAKELSCEVTMLHSVGDQIRRTRQSLYGSGYIPFDMEKMFTDLIKDTQRNLEKRNRRWQKEGLKIKSEATAKEETLDKTLQRKIKEGFDLIIMGTHSDQLMKAFLGSSARKVILSSPIPVIVVRSKPEKSS
ncbi:universal stress protein [Bdellovibrio sp. BCCA]|uniref:universal stress protein n=1 Tax=Bdellovibrio sp. BCCA TaxID=3136281 RepID=UPI0030F35E1C